MMRRQLGKRMRQVRESAGYSLADVDEAQVFSISTMQRLESGKRRVSAGDVLSLGNLYGLSRDETDVLVDMAKGTRDDGYMQEYGGKVPDHLNTFAALEASASTILTYDPSLVAGLVQTPAYARATVVTDSSLDEPTIRARIAFRMERRVKVLRREKPARVKVILGAGALSLVVGSPQVMQEQLEYLRTVSDGDLVDVRVVPWTAGAKAHMRGSFTVMDFDDPEDPPVVHFDTQVGSKFLEQWGALARYRKSFADLSTLSVPIKEYEL
jgi:transcriptional regulator with XRE-family HTH domain